MTSKLEQWLPIPAWPEYEVSNFGSVRNVAKRDRTRVGRLLKGWADGNGYRRVVLCRRIAGQPGGQRRDVRVHVLVAAAFLGPQPSPRHIVAHFDGDTANNRSSNLRWATNADNYADSVRHGTAALGSRNAMAKLSDKEVRSIRRLLEKHSQRAVAAMFDVSQTAIWNVASGRRWKHLA